MLLCLQIPYTFIVPLISTISHIYDINRNREGSIFLILPCLISSENCRKLPSLFTVASGRFDQPRSAKGAKSDRGNKTNPVHASGRIKIPLVSFVRISEIPEWRRVSCARSRLLCAFEHVMIAVSSSTQEKEQVFPFFVVLSDCLNLRRRQFRGCCHSEKQG